jgi:hypothetical protein
LRRKERYRQKRGGLRALASALSGYRASANGQAVVLHDQVARTSPNAHARRIEFVGALRPLTGVRTVPVLGYGHRGRQAWVRVRLPGRPNGHAGWIPPRQTRRASTGWHILIALSARMVTVYHYGRTEQRFLAVVGKPRRRVRTVSSSSGRPSRSPPKPRAARTRLPPAPDRTSCRNSTAAQARSASTAPATSRGTSGPQRRTDASG